MNKNHRSNNHHESKNYIQLPSAQSLAEYEKLSKGAAERIIEMIEEEQIQRHEIENYIVKSNNLYRYFCLITEFVILFATILSSMFFLNHSILASITMIISGFGLVLSSKIIGKLKHNLNKNKSNNKDKHNQSKEKQKDNLK